MIQIGPGDGIWNYGRNGEYSEVDSEDTNWVWEMAGCCTVMVLLPFILVALIILGASCVWLLCWFCTLVAGLLVSVGSSLINTPWVLVTSHLTIGLLAGFGLGLRAQKPVRKV